jgi:hypothetical protein
VPFEVEVHTGFDFWLAGVEDASPEVRESMERANAAVVPTSRLAAVEAAYWCEIGPRRHLRWVLPQPEEELLDAIARLHAGAFANLPVEPDEELAAHARHRRPPRVAGDRGDHGEAPGPVADRRDLLVVEHGLHRRADRFFGAHVEREHGVLERRIGLGLPTGAEDAEATLGQELGSGPADTGGGAGDEGNSPKFHGSILD